MLDNLDQKSSNQIEHISEHVEVPSSSNDKVEPNLISAGLNLFYELWIWLRSTTENITDFTWIKSKSRFFIVKKCITKDMYWSLQKKEKSIDTWFSFWWISVDKNERGFALYGCRTLMKAPHFRKRMRKVINMIGDIIWQMPMEEHDRNYKTNFIKRASASRKASS